MNKKINGFIVHKNYSIRKVMECINKTGIGGIAIVTDSKKRLLGVVTDGDLRRALIANKNLETPINSIMTKNPIKMPEGTSATELLEVMINKNISQIPIVNEKNVLVDVTLLSELKSIPLSSPDITKREIEIINQVLSTPCLSIGPKIIEFEKKMAEYIGAKYAVAVNSGTSALHLCIRSLGIKDGDEVITTSFSFIASANCILYERAKPVFVDIDAKTLCIDTERIEKKITRRTKAILPVHVFGHPCEMDRIMEIAKRYGLAIIEDACEAIGSDYKGKKAGSFGDVGVFAFYPNKQITTAEGGMIVTNDENIAKLCRSMRNQGRDEHSGWLSHSRLGYNYRMSELSASMGVVQMERVDEILDKRRKVASIYNKKLKNIDGIKTPFVSPTVNMSWFVYVVILDRKRFTGKDRNNIMHKLKSRGVSCSNYFPPIHLEPFYIKMFGYEKGNFPVTERISELTIALPFHNNLAVQEIDYVCKNLKEVISKI